jgi:hypothetical protein
LRDSDKDKLQRDCRRFDEKERKENEEFEEEDEDW